MAQSEKASWYPEFEFAKVRLPRRERKQCCMGDSSGDGAAGRSIGAPSLFQNHPIAHVSRSRCPFIKHADDRRARARARAVLRVRDRAADCVGSCIPNWAVSQPIADQIKAVPVLAGTDLVNVLDADSGHFHPVVCSPKSLSDSLDQPKAVLFGTRGFHIFHHVHNCLISLPLFWPSLSSRHREVISGRSLR